MPNQKTFLLIADDEDFIVLAEGAFAKFKLGHLRTVGDGLEAIRYMAGVGGYTNRESFPLPDLILLDLDMPHMDAFQFLKSRKETAPVGVKTIPVIVTSKLEVAEQKALTVPLGAIAFLPKPIDWAVFRDNVAEFGVDFKENVAHRHKISS
jgi:two-component system response regulator